MTAARCSRATTRSGERSSRWGKQAPPGPGSFEAVLARIAGDPGPAPTPRSPPAAALPVPLCDYVAGGLDALRWQRIGAGVRQALLKTGPGARARLLSIPAGVAVPEHGHGGVELTLVLKGAFRDEFDRFARGDLEVANESHRHTPVAEEGEPCLCLAAADAPLRFSALLPRLVQRFVRI